MIGPEVEEAFERIARTLSYLDGFALIPVEVTGPDLGRALAAWLGARGMPTHVVEPLDEPAWRSVVASLLDGADSRVTMLIGPRAMVPGMAAGLRLVNQRRDSIVEALGRPLLWCGPQELLNATWERAPDFWSIRGMMHRVHVSARAPSESPLWAGVVVRDAPERLRETLRAAREQGDKAMIARLGVQLAEALLASGEYDEASEVIDETLGDASGEARGSLALLRARAAFAQGDVEKARAALDEAERGKTQDPAFEALLAAARGNLALRDDAEGAKRAYEVALAAAKASGDRRNEAVVLADIGVAQLALGEAEAALATLESARASLRDVGDERGEARCLVHIGRAHAALFDARSAAVSFEEALERVRAHGDRRGEARVLCHVARAYLDAGDAEKAIEDAGRAAELARATGDERIVARAEAVLAMARSAAS